ncbi:hypothetical protein Lal_00003972, partial [Lupinus albus]
RLLLLLLKTTLVRQMVLSNLHVTFPRLRPFGSSVRRLAWWDMRPTLKIFRTFFIWTLLTSPTIALKTTLTITNMDTTQIQNLTGWRTILGLGGDAKKRVVRNMVRKENLDFLCIQETKLEFI